MWLINVSAETGFRDMIIEAGLFQEAALLRVGHHGRGKNLGNGVEVRKHIASQGTVNSWRGIHGGNRTRGLEATQVHCQASHVNCCAFRM